MDDIVIGRIVGVSGCGGHVKVISFTEPRDNFLQFKSWLVGREAKPYAVLDVKRKGRGIAARLDGVNDRDRAAAMMDSQIAIKREWLGALPRGEYYWFELTGLRVFNQDGAELGAITKLLETGANDVLVVEGQGPRYLIPYVRDTVVTAVDCERRRMRVKWNREWRDAG